jgi:hypothetical protein
MFVPKPEQNFIKTSLDQLLLYRKHYLPYLLNKLHYWEVDCTEPSLCGQSTLSFHSQFIGQKSP